MSTLAAASTDFTVFVTRLMNGGITWTQLWLALLTPALLTALLAPVTLWLYRRR